jgi:stage II sporulation protein D
MKYLLSLILAISINATTAQVVDVRLFSNYGLTQAWISVHTNAYTLLAVGAKGVTDTLLILNQNGSTKLLHIQTHPSGLIVKAGDKNLGTFGQIDIIEQGAGGHFIIKGKGRERMYSGNITLKKRGTDLLVINRVLLEEYVAGVVESEGGHVNSYAYFCAQAVLARTWVLRNWKKHLDEGYNVKDDQTSQAYYSKAYLQNSAEILRATRATADTVLLYGDKELVFGAFHANSGGQTVSSEDYWSESIPYLKGVQDTFSLKMEKTHWQKEIDKEKFIGFFAQQMGFSASDTNFRKAVLGFKQPTRHPWFTYQGKTLKVRAVREKFQLRSTFFNVTDAGKNVVLDGRGFGHGIGLSQEGAMRMAALGYGYKAILKHYFAGTHLGSISEIKK